MHWANHWQRYGDALVGENEAAVANQRPCVVFSHARVTDCGAVFRSLERVRAWQDSPAPVFDWNRRYGDGDISGDIAMSAMSQIGRKMGILDAPWVE